MITLPITEMLVLFIWVRGSPFSTSHTYTPLSSAITLSMVRLLLESNTQVFALHVAETEFVTVILELRIWIEKFRLISSVPFLFSHMILGAGNPVASHVIVIVADSLTFPPSVTIGELGGTGGEDRLEQVKMKEGTFITVNP